MEGLLCPAIILGLIALIFLLWWFGTLGRLNALRSQILEARGALVAQLRQRYDLIPVTLKAAREGVGAEMEYLMGILDTRKELARPNSRDTVDPGAPLELQPVLAAMSNGGSRSIHESNPTAAAPAALYQQFMKINSSTEKDVTAGRRFVEAAIGEYNAAVRTFPAVIVALLHGHKPVKNAKLTKKLATLPDYFA